MTRDDDVGPEGIRWQDLVKLAPGVYRTDTGVLHLKVRELLTGNGYADTRANRDLLIDMAIELFAGTATITVIE